MASPDSIARRRTHFTLVTLAVAVASILLFFYTLGTVGLAEIGDALRRLGPVGFLLVLLLSGARFVARGAAWITCQEGERRLRLRDVVAASLMGEALGNLTPLATLASEPAKALLVRDRVALPVALSSLVVENLFYTATVGGVIGVGALAFLLQFPMPAALRAASYVAIAGTLVIVAGAWWILGFGAKPVSATMQWLGQRRLGGRWIEAHAGRVRRFEEKVNGFASRNRPRLGALACCELAFHLAGVAEVYVTLSFIAPDSVTLVKALVLEALGRVVNVLFKFIPMRFGVDEAGNLLLAHPLGLPQASLVALPLVRKARLLVWTALGVALLLRRGLSVRRALREAEQVGGES